MKQQPQTKENNVWDPLIRLFHWILVLACSVAYFTQEKDYELHLQSGYLVLGLVGLRVLWGFLGTTHARFRDFVFSPGEVVRYLKSVAAGSAQRYMGHNPAGGMMVVAMLLNLLIITLSGVALDGAENRAGPLADSMLFLYTDMIKSLHELATDIWVVMVALHLLGVVHTSIVHRENLVRSMVTGRKRV